MVEGKKETVPPKRKLPPDPYPPHNAPRSQILLPAHNILAAANRSATNFWYLFGIMRSDAKGTSSDWEQDLLRAMLVFASAGLDNMMKRAVEDALPTILKVDAAAREQLTKYAESRIGKRDAVTGDFTLDHRLLTRLLLAPSPNAGFVQELVLELTANSLQSKAEVMKVLAYFAIDPAVVCKDPTALDQIFKTRNKIVHEMDVDLTGKTRKRTSRTQSGMTTATKVLLDVGAAFLAELDSKLVAPRTP